MQALVQKLVICAIVAVSCATAASAQVTPRLWGTSYAIAMAPTSVVLGRQHAPVRVSARLPQALYCSRVLSVAHQAVDQGAVLRDPLLGAPVSVVIEPGPCRGDWRDGWADFVVAGPTGSDILDVTLIAPDGRLLMHERIAIETSVAGGARR